MKKNISFLFIFIFLILSGVNQLFAQSSKFVQKLEWTASTNAASYKVEIKSLNTSEITVFTTKNTFVEFSLPAGNYEYRVLVYDFLGRVRAQTNWEVLEILKAVQPEVSNISESVELSKSNQDEVTIPVDIKSVNEDSSVVLINQETGEIVEGDILIEENDSKSYKDAYSVLFPLFKEGKWKLKITNPGGLYTESPVMEIGYKESDSTIVEGEEPVVESDEKVEEEEEPVVESDEKVEEEEEPVVESDEKVEEEEEPVVESVEKVEEEEEPVVESDEKVEEKEEPVVESDEQNIHKPYKHVGLSLNIGGGYSLFVPVFDTGLHNYAQDITPSICGALELVPAIDNKLRFGGELKTTGTIVHMKTELLEITIPIMMSNLNFICHYQLVKDKLFVAGKVGGGVTLLMESINKNYGSDSVKGYGYINGMIGTSIVWNPTKGFQIEAGADCYLNFITGMFTPIVNPYLTIGVRF